MKLTHITADLNPPLDSFDEIMSVRAQKNDADIFWFLDINGTMYFINDDVELAESVFKRVQGEIELLAGRVLTNITVVN
jgi:hypothetical protein